MSEKSNSETNGTCIICNQPSIKSYPLRKCIVCSNLIHRRCAKTPPGSTSIHCPNCSYDRHKEEEKKKKGNTMSDSSATLHSRVLSTKGRTSTVKKTTPPLRLSSSNDLKLLTSKGTPLASSSSAAAVKRGSCSTPPTQISM